MVVPGVVQARIYNCPICNADTPHIVKGKRGDVFGLECSNCASGSLVRQDELDNYEVQWEEDLRKLLENLSAEFEGDEQQ
ncbi:MAG: hypothetical protein PHV61_00565 [Limnochordia bacterium]|nr:hypothetical protein [Limnochordia bacterium]MDD2628653.1 hypothetical protein [Limnochordia bacterium]MDD4516908.1 hypothetical protein [Limnochordia bacterium]